MPSDNVKCPKGEEGVKYPRWTQQEVERLLKLRRDLSIQLERKVRDKELEASFNTYGDTYRSEEAIKSKLKNLRPQGLCSPRNLRALGK